MTVNLNIRKKPNVVYVYKPKIYYTCSTYLIGKNRDGKSLRLELDDTDANKQKPLHTKEGRYIKMVPEEIITVEELSEHLKLRNLLNSVSNGTEVFSRFDEISVRDLNELFEEEGVSFAISYKTRFNSKYQENILRFTSKTFNGVYRIDNDLIVIKLNNDNIVLRIENLVD